MLTFFSLGILNESFQLIEFDDPNDQVKINDNATRVYPMDNFQWKRVMLPETNERVAIQFIGSNYTSSVNGDDTIKSGLINLTVSIQASVISRIIFFTLSLLDFWLRK